MYVDLQQFAAVLLPLESAVFYPNGNSPGNTMENSGKQNPKMGFKSPTEQRRKFNRAQVTTSSILSIDFSTD